MRKQTHQQQQTQGITSKDNDNNQQIQTQDNKLLSPKTGYVQHTSPFRLYTDHTSVIVNVLLSCMHRMLMWTY